MFWGGSFVISIHAPKRERHDIQKNDRECCNFNPRSQAGATVWMFFAKVNIWDFNPRSQAGATIVCPFLPLLCQFQSTLPSGSDNLFVCVKVWYPIFQSTLPSGSDMLVLAVFSGISNFNPRSQAGATSNAP